MLVLCIRTDKPEAELELWLDGEQRDTYLWQAHRQLAETLHKKVRDLLAKGGYDWRDLQGLVTFEGPGSFTGLRIGISFANALAYSLSVPIVGSSGDSWANEGVVSLEGGQTGKLVMPEYGAPVHLTQPKR